MSKCQGEIMKSCFITFNEVKTFLT